jgi:hypothetical protein
MKEVNVEVDEDEEAALKAAEGAALLKARFLVSPQDLLQHDAAAAALAAAKAKKMKSSAHAAAAASFAAAASPSPSKKKDIDWNVDEPGT